MGNRAVITTKENFENNGIGVYLHWNGGRDSVEAFLKYCELKGYRPPSEDHYGWARLCQVIGNFFGGTSSIGIDVVSHLDCDNYDNGVYFIDGWKIVGREYFSGSEQDYYDMMDALESIDKCMPETEQILPFIKGKKVSPDELKVGDEIVYIDNIWNGLQTSKIIGIGKEGNLNGTETGGNPYINRFGDEHPENNPNNYIKQKWGGIDFRLKIS